MSRNVRLDSIALVGIAFFAFMILNVLKDQSLFQFNANQNEPVVTPTVQIDSNSSIGTGGAAERRIEISGFQAETFGNKSIDSDAIAAPYAHFAVTQGPHGFDYGHMAVDLTAGKGVEILSPINGVVANLYIDEWGNPSLVLENDRYIVELLHGSFSVQIGDQVILGQPIGFESNQGNTADAWGYSCRGRDCGYHTHINVFDKILATNINPLDLFPPQQ